MNITIEVKNVQEAELVKQILNMISVHNNESVVSCHLGAYAGSPQNVSFGYFEKHITQ